MQRNLAPCCPRLGKGNVAVNVDGERLEVEHSLLHRVCELWLQCDSQKGRVELAGGSASAVL